MNKITIHEIELFISRDLSMHVVLLQERQKNILREETRNRKMIHETKICGPNTLDWYIRFGGTFHRAGIFEENVCKFTSAYPHKCNMNFELVFSRSLLLYMHKNCICNYRQTPIHSHWKRGSGNVAIFRIQQELHLFIHTRAHPYTQR